MVVVRVMATGVLRGGSDVDGHGRRQFQCGEPTLHGHSEIFGVVGVVGVFAAFLRRELSRKFRLNRTALMFPGLLSPFPGSDTRPGAAKRDVAADVSQQTQPRVKRHCESP
jgi:hypothetical protein